MDNETRLSSGLSPTQYQYTGQYSYTADFGLMYYNARWYDPTLGRFAQADTIINSEAIIWLKLTFSLCFLPSQWH